LGYFGSRQPPEELHFYDLSLSLIDARQLVEGIVQSQELGISVDRQGSQILVVDFASPVTFGRSTAAGVVHKDLTHCPRGNGDEMRPVLQLNRLASCQSDVRLVDEGRALQGVIRSFGLELVVSETPQLLVHQGHESAEGFFIALRPLLQKLGHLTGLIFGHALPRSPVSEEGHQHIRALARRQSPLISSRWSLFASSNFLVADEAFHLRFPPICAERGIQPRQKSKPSKEKRK
jgi:hypothetical protein